jgi:hypothetical protein
MVAWPVISNHRQSADVIAKTINATSQEQHKVRSYLVSFLIHIFICGFSLGLRSIPLPFAT